LSAYAFGLLIGLAPLLSYLVSAGVVRDFISWVIVFNGKALEVSIHFPLAFVAAGGWGAVALLRRYRGSGDSKALLLFYAFCLSTASSLTTMPDNEGLYYLGMWYFICAAAVSGVGIPGMLAKVPLLWKRALIAGLVFGVLLSPNCASIWKYRRGDFAQNKAAAAELMKYTKGGPCVILLPVHPVFARDATRLYSSWQYYFVTRFPQVRDDSQRSEVAKRIMVLQPHVVQCRQGKRDFILELFQRKVITSAEYKELMAFLTAHYRQQQIGKNVYYLKTL
jgi:hypothetical protein